MEPGRKCGQDETIANQINGSSVQITVRIVRVTFASNHIAEILSRSFCSL